MKKPKIILEHVERISRFKDNITFKGDYIRLRTYATALIQAIDERLKEKEPPSGFYFALTHSKKEVAKLRRKSKSA